MTGIVYLIIACLICVFIHIFGMYFAARLLKMKIEEVSIFYGPALLEFMYKETAFRIKLLPFGGYVRLEGESYKSKPFYEKAFLSFSGCLLLLLLADLFLDTNELWRLTKAVPVTLLEGAISFEKAKNTFLEINQFVSNNSFARILASTSMALFVFNMLPIPNLNGGQIIINFVEAIYKLKEKEIIALALTGIAVSLALMISWGISFCRFLVGQ